MEINGPDSGAFIRLGARNMLPRPCEQKASELKANATHGLSMATWPSGTGGVYQSISYIQLSLRLVGTYRVGGVRVNSFTFMGSCSLGT